MVAPTQYAYRTLKGIGILDAAPVYEALKGFTRPEGNFRCCTYSPCGRYFAWASPGEVTVIDASSGSVAAILPTANVYELGFSPQGSFIITWERPTKDEEGNACKNLKVWRVLTDGTGERNVHGQFVQKSQTGWNLQYTQDERYCARTVTNEVQFYESGDLRLVWNKLRVEGVSDFALSPGKQNHSVAVFIPERKGQPAAVKVFDVPQFERAVSQKTFFKGDKVQLKWNGLGTSLLVLAQTEVDKSGKSYYGETTLYILSANGGFDSRIQLDKEGPIHDVTWSPSSKEFGVVYGYMPAKATIFNERAVATHEFPLKPRNTILFSPSGRFVIVAGFGNLAGQMDIYDIEKDYNKVTTIESTNPSVCEWSPDGTHILTATTSPRLRVDNGVRIWHVTGGLMYTEDMNELYHVCWRPQPEAMKAAVDPLRSVPTAHVSAVGYLASVKTPSKPAGAYRPPGARGTSTPLHFKREDEGGAAHTSSNGLSPSVVANGFGKSRRREVPGSEAANASPLPAGAAPGGGVSLTGTPDGDETLSKTALKNKKKREARKAKDAMEKAGDPTGAEATSHTPETNGTSETKTLSTRPRRASRDAPPKTSRSRSRSDAVQRRDPSKNWERKGSEAALTTGEAPSKGKATPSRPNVQTTPNPAPGTSSQQAAILPPDVSVTSPAGGNTHEKKLRGLLKKIRAIDDLKMRLAGGEQLEDTQMKKIHTEEDVRKELDTLGYDE